MEIRELSSDSDLLIAFPVLKELRPSLTPTALVNSFPDQKSEGYRLFAAVVDDKTVACIGWRLQTMLYSGKTLYVDDLVTAPAHRGKGYARALLEHAQEQALAAGCRTFSLDSGHQRHDAHRVYLNFGMKITSHHFQKELGI